MDTAIEENPTYAKPNGNSLVVVLPDGSTRPAGGEITLYHATLRSLIMSSAYPCVGAKAAFNRDTYRMALYPEMGTAQTTQQLLHDVERFVAERPSLKAPYRSFVACFAGPYFPDEASFSAALWGQLQQLHELDIVKYPWDPSVSSDVDDPEFSFSLVSTAFFVVGLHPAASRYARKFMVPTLIFNAHDQFEALREQELFQGLRDVIRDRDTTLQGKINPNLVDFGQASEARQYSGAHHQSDWSCPFNRKLESTE